MKRHLNTSYRLVWNHITGTLVVASELARSRGKRAGVAVALSLAAVTPVPALAADTVVEAGETVNGGTLTNHDNQIVFGTTNGMTISTGLEYGTDNEANTGGQWVQDGGTASNTTISSGGLQFVGAGGKATDTIINEGGGQSLKGLALNTTLNGGEQWMHEGAIATGTVINDKGWQVVKPGAVATDTVVNTGAEGGPDAENGDTGQFVRGNAVRTTINKNGRQIVTVEGTANTTVVYAGGDQTVHGHALDTTLNGGIRQLTEISVLTKSIGGKSAPDWAMKQDFRCGCWLMEKPETAMKAITRNLDREIWRDLMQRSGMLSLMDAQARDTWYRSLEYDNFPEISEANILSTFEQLHQNKDEVFERGVINVFRGLSWNYKTNCPCKFGSKIIVNNLVRWDRWGFHLITGQQADRLADLERMLHLFSGKPIPDNRENITIRLDDHIQSVQGKESYEDEMFSIRYFKKGSAHITFRKPELVDRLNDIIAKRYPGQLSAI